MKIRAKERIDFLIERYPELEKNKQDLYKALGLLIDCYAKQRKIMLCGNGGSAADCEHIVAELMKSYQFPRKLPLELKESLEKVNKDHYEYIYKNLEVGLPALSLVSQVGISTAFANDRRPDLAFAQQVLCYGKEDDVLWILSTSGNSKNTIYAAEMAKAKGVKVFGLLGRNGGKLKNICDVAICIGKQDGCEIQEMQLPIYHALCSALEYEFFCM